MFDLSGQVALITGGNSGIGLAMGHALAEAGADVSLWARRLPGLPARRGFHTGDSFVVDGGYSIF